MKGTTKLPPRISQLRHYYPPRTTSTARGATPAEPSQDALVYLATSCSGNMCPVRIVDVSYVAVPATAVLPSEPIKLTAMEALWVNFPVLQHVLLFEGGELPPFDNVLQSLRFSLAEALASFAPLAGKLVHLADTGDVAISCSASDGVRFVVAESNADIRRLAGDEEHDLHVLEQLVPELDMSELPTSVLAVQATRFEGGMALGVTIHHGIADGRSLWKFIEAWAAACRGETPAAAPSFDRSLIKIPGGEELARSALRKLSPNLPVASTLTLIEEEDRRRFSRRTFTLDARDIQRLKQRIVHLGEAHGAPLHRAPSTFAAVIALAWTSFARCKPFAADDDVLLFFFADVRDRLDPPAGPGYFGVCLTACIARLPAQELHGERALAVAVSAVQDEVRKMMEDPLAGWDFMSMVLTVPMYRLMNVSGSPGFTAYEVADFGWGKPRRTEPIRMNHDGQVALMRSKDGHGVQVSVSLLHPAHMDEFKSQFLQLLG